MRTEQRLRQQYERLTSGLRDVMNEPRLPPLPKGYTMSNWKLACTYKLLRALANEYDKLPVSETGKYPDNGEKMILAKVRYMVGQDPFEMDRVSYAEMRQFINLWMVEL